MATETATPEVSQLLRENPCPEGIDPAAWSAHILKLQGEKIARLETAIDKTAGLTGPLRPPTVAEAALLVGQSRLAERKASGYYGLGYRKPGT